MRYFFISFSLLTILSPFTLFATSAAPIAFQPTPFISVMYASYDGDFYDRQAREWQDFATGECSTDDAWFNYYKTAQYSNRFGTGDYDLKAIVAQAEKRCDPEGFAIHYLRFAQDNHPTERHAHLLKAYAADPEQVVASTGLSAYYTVNGMPEKRNETLRWMHQRRPIPTGVMEYNYNQLVSVTEKGILITIGDADTFPSWLLQSAYGVRPDVLVVNIHLLLGYESYRKHLKDVLGMKRLFADDNRNAASLLEQLATQERPVFFATTGRDMLAELPAEHLYLTGLTFHYSTTPIDNLRLITRRYREDWRMEQLRQPFTDSPAQRVSDQLNQNYLPALLELYERKPGTPQLKSLIESLADRAGMTETVRSYLEPGDDLQLASKQPGLRAKEIAKGIAYIPGGEYRWKDAEQPPVTVNGFHLQTTEVSNADYQLFLEDLLRQRKFAILDSVKIAAIDLEELFPGKDPVSEIAMGLTGGHPAFAEYPVLNISHRAAQLYARWLSQVYNQDPKRKDGRNVRFRLPTAEEFAYAARGGREWAPYPWGGPYYRNAKGCILANFNTTLELTRKDLYGDYRGVAGKKTSTEKDLAAGLAAEKARLRSKDGCNDGGEFTVRVTAFYPNDYGLYNMSGNAAEMTAVDGQTIGGSWYDPAYNMQIGVVTERKLPHPSTGFRLVMVYEN